MELLVISFLDQWPHRNQSYFYYDWMCRDFFAWLTWQRNAVLFVESTSEYMNIGEDWLSRTQSAFSRAFKACELEEKNDMLAAGDEWQKIFGTHIAKSV